MWRTARGDYIPKLKDHPMSEKRKFDFSNAWSEARELIWAHRRRLVVGLGLMILSRLAALVLPVISKILIDEVVANRRADLLWPLAAAAGGATLVQVITSFSLSQILGVAAQRAITEMRKRVQQHVTQLPVGFYDSTKTGVLISRIMTDAEGIRNLVGSGLVQLTGGVFTAVLALTVLFYLNWRLTSLTLLILLLFGAAMAYAFKRFRPLFRARGEINAQVTGRLAETLGAVRLVKAYTAERREQYVFSKGVHKLFRNVAKAVTGVSALGAFATLIIGAIGVVMIVV